MVSVCRAGAKQNTCNKNKKRCKTCDATDGKRFPPVGPRDRRENVKGSIRALPAAKRGRRAKHAPLSLVNYLCIKNDCIFIIELE